MATEQIRVDDLMRSSGVGFGTSGARGRVEDITDKVAYSYTLAFLQHLEDSGELSKGSTVAIAGDHRSSTPRILSAVAAAIEDHGYAVAHCGNIASPAVAYYGLAHQIPSIMVTGSHIPDDRNGIKFNKAGGEILKEDEVAIKLQLVNVEPEYFDSHGNFVQPRPLPEVEPSAHQAYVNRYLDFFPTDCLQGLSIGLYEHSTVVRQALYEVLTGLGAQVTKLGYSEIFLPVDTEAIREEDIRLAREWSAQSDFNAIVSADGDGDRPLISDEHGNWLRGDIVGILAATALKADVIVTPVSSNTAVEKSGRFKQVHRTRIGSPYVIEAMQTAHEAQPDDAVIGYEANGGFLTETALRLDGKELTALPTRDAILPIIAILLLSREQRRPISALLADLPARYTYSNRLKEFPTELSRTRLEEFILDDEQQALENVTSFLGPDFAKAESLDHTDGVRITLANSEIVHLRPSGNAPELRCYTEADSESRAIELNHMTMERLRSWI
jgi:phosphomannomutase